MLTFRLQALQISIISNETQEAVFLSTGGWNPYNMRQAAPKDAQKSTNLLYLVSLRRNGMKGSISANKIPIGIVAFWNGPFVCYSEWLFHRKKFGNESSS